jgi:hypothetical protein
MRYGLFISWVTIGYEQYTVLRAANFDAKTFELCESSTDYLWNCIAYTGVEIDTTTSINVSDIPQSLKIVVRLVEPHVNLGYPLWMDRYHVTSNSRCNFFSHFSKLKIKLCLKCKVFLPILQMSWKHHCSWRASDLRKRVLTFILRSFNSVFGLPLRSFSMTAL